MLTMCLNKMISYLLILSYLTRFRERQRSTCDDLILTTDEGDISVITYSPDISNSDHIMI